MMKKKLLKFMAVVLCTMFFGCEKYLAVDPKSTLSEDQLFENEIGFQQALSGVYSQLASRGLYGDNLTMGFVSALAQNYNVSGSAAPFVSTRALDYTSAEVIGHTTSLWGAGYTAIAGVNKILQNVERRRDVLSDYGFAMIKGEALAIRALLHFDLLRIFGPEYSEGKDLKSIPYKTTTDQYATTPGSGAQVIESIIKDLEDAQNLVRGIDPVSSSPNRRIKMNYYGMRALEARIKLYTGDTEGAILAAKEVVESDKYSFVTQQALTTSAGFKDRLYTTELIFCLRVTGMKNWVDQEYFRSQGSASVRLTQTANNFNILFEKQTGGALDYRSIYGIELDGTILFPSKYWQTYQYTTLDSNRLDQLVPVIRLSEMYYILAETAPNTVEGVNYLNQVRINRALEPLDTGISRDILLAEITKEYQKEFYAEGQLFPYYKRKKTKRMQFMSKDITLDKYVLPIPDLELEFNPSY